MKRILSTPEYQLVENIDHLLDPGANCGEGWLWLSMIELALNEKRTLGRELGRRIEAGLRPKGEPVQQLKHIDWFLHTHEDIPCSLVWIARMISKDEERFLSDVRRRFKEVEKGFSLVVQTFLIELENLEFDPIFRNGRIKIDITKLTENERYEKQKIKRSRIHSVCKRSKRCKRAKQSNG